MLKKKLKNLKFTMNRVNNVGTWDSLSDAVLYISIRILFVNTIINILGYLLFCFLADFQVFASIYSMPIVQKSLVVFIILNVLISSFVQTYFLVNYYNKIIHKPLIQLMKKLRSINNDENDYLLSGKLTRPFSSVGDETWLDMVQGYVDMNSAEKYMDELTHCFNRKYFQQVMVDFMKVQFMGKNQNPSIPKTYSTDVYAVFLIDIDHFKKVNDDFGHAAGDDVLRSVSFTLRNLIGDKGVVIRNGGEEFLIVMMEKFPYDFSKTAQAINDAFRREISVSSRATGEVRNITCSVGYVSYPIFDGDANILSLQDHVDLADQAMYLAKTESRDTWRELVSLKRPGSNVDLVKLCNDVQYGVDKGIFTVRKP